MKESAESEHLGLREALHDNGSFRSLGILSAFFDAFAFIAMRVWDPASAGGVVWTSVAVSVPFFPEASASFFSSLVASLVPSASILCSLSCS